VSLTPHERRGVGTEQVTPTLIQPRDHIGKFAEISNAMVRPVTRSAGRDGDYLLYDLLRDEA